jgi:C-terminal processing protease CtpA/Prc
VAKSIIRFLGSIFVLVTIAACGGSGDGAGFSPPAPPPPPPSATWQPGVFLASSSFKNQCAAPRSGADATNNGRPFPDLQGTVVDENDYLRSFSDETYLWYDEITDRDPGTFGDPISYFAQLKTFATLPSGREKDPDSFHFAVDTLEWFNLFQGGVSAGYGAEWAVLSATVPRDIVVAYTEPNSPATNNATPLLRGTRILSIDGFDIDTNSQAGVNALNNGLFPSGIGETHTFVVQDIGEIGSHTVTLTTASVTVSTVQNTRVINNPLSGEDVGYLTFNTHTSPAESDLIDAINALAGVDDLIVDLRYNGGGFGAIASQLAYMVAGQANTTGKVFDLLQFSDKHPVTNPITLQPIAPDPFYSQTLGISSLPAGNPLPTLNLSRVIVLTGPGTASASELFMNGLRGADVQVIQIGTTTRGKPYGFYEEPNCGTSYFTVQFRSVNEKNWGDYAEGFAPGPVDDGEATVLGCTVADDYTKPLGDVGENRLEVALAYQAGMGCITPVSASSDAISKPGMPLNATDGEIFKSPFDSNLIMRRP